MRQVTIMVLVLVVTAGAANANLVAHWTFDGSANDSVGSNHGIIYGAQFVDGRFGQALQFDGSNDYVVTASGISDLPTSDHTIALWAKHDDLNSGVTIAAGDALYYWQLSYSSHNDKYFGQWDDDVDRKIAASDNPAIVGVWTHLAMRRSGNEYAVFVNGIKQIDVKTVNNDFTITNPIYIGVAQNASMYYFDGAIDDARIYDNALLDSDIQALVPEPATITLLLCGGLMVLKRKKQF